MSVAPPAKPLDDKRYTALINVLNKLRHFAANLDDLCETNNYRFDKCTTVDDRLITTQKVRLFREGGIDYLMETTQKETMKNKVREITDDYIQNVMRTIRERREEYERFLKEIGNPNMHKELLINNQNVINVYNANLLFNEIIKETQTNTNISNDLITDAFHIVEQTNTYATQTNVINNFQGEDYETNIKPHLEKLTTSINDLNEKYTEEKRKNKKLFPSLFTPPVTKAINELNKSVKSTESLSRGGSTAKQTIRRRKHNSHTKKRKSNTKKRN